MKTTSFSIRFIDIMIGVVLGIGFTWWPKLVDPWQYIAFLFVYVDIVDYWVDYVPALRKVPPRRELDLFIDVAIVFSLFLSIFATQVTITYFLGALILVRILDIAWILRARRDHAAHPDISFLSIWMYFDIAEIIGFALLLFVGTAYSLTSFVQIIIVVLFWIIMRVFAGLKYKKIHFV